MEKLTAKQREALQKLSTTFSASAYRMQVSLSTLEALLNRRLVMAIGAGHMAFPRNGQWQITSTGRAALQSDPVPRRP